MLTAMCLRSRSCTPSSSARSHIHANSPEGALEQLALMVMQAGLGLSRSETIVYARSVIDIVVQLERQGGERRIGAIMIN